MTALLMADGAYLRDPAAVKAAGAVAWGLYVSGQDAVPDGFATRVRAAGIAPLPIYEVGISELVSDRAAGQAAARVAVADAARAGFPADGTIMAVFCVDVEVAPADYPKVAAAFQGVRDVVAGRYLVACYGQGDLIAYLARRGVTDAKGCLSESAGFPGFDARSPYIAVVQNHDAAGNWMQPPPGMDLSTIVDLAALRAWWPPDSPYNIGDAVTPQELKAIIDGVHAAIQPDLLRLASWLGGNGNAVFNDKSLPTVPAGVALQPAAAAPGNQALLRVAALQAQVQAVADQVAAVPTVHPTVDVAAVAAAVAEQVVAKLPQNSLTAAEITAAVTAAAPSLIFRGATS